MLKRVDALLTGKGGRSSYLQRFGATMTESLQDSFDELLGHMASCQPHLTTIKGSIPADLPVENGSRFMFISKDQRLLTHALHKYPAKFFPELPRWLIEKYSNEGDLILDPFMGSGTTNLECMLLGRDSIGIDVDPFSRMLASAKTTPLPERALQSAWRKLRERVAS